LAQLGIRNGSDALLQIWRHSGARCRAPLGLRRRPLHLADSELHGVDRELQRFEPLQELTAEQRKFLRPWRRGHEDREHAALQWSRLGAARDAITEQPAPRIAIDGDAGSLGRNDARAVQ
jgi:hypothetical protein